MVTLELAGAGILHRRPNSCHPLRRRDVRTNTAGDQARVTEVAASLCALTLRETKFMSPTTARIAALLRVPRGQVLVTRAESLGSGSS